MTQKEIRERRNNYSIFRSDNQIYIIMYRILRKTQHFNNILNEETNENQRI